MLVLAMLLVVGAGAHERAFNVTGFILPKLVKEGQREIEIECQYDADFTLLTMYKGSQEFFRYRPGTAPTTRSFGILGVGTIDIVICGPTACRLRLGELTEEASGLYRCEIERDVKPFKFSAMSAGLTVPKPASRQPSLEGLAREYGEGDIIKAYCRGSPKSQFRWYINGQEIIELRNSTSLMRTSTRLMFKDTPPRVAVQCVEFREGKIYGSTERLVRWNEKLPIRADKAYENRLIMENGSNINTGRLDLLSVILLLLNIKKYV